jgi:hypothetical protein
VSYAFVKEYSSFATDIDLNGEAPADVNAGAVGRVEVVTAGGGGLAMKIAGAVTATVALTGLAAGDVPIYPEKILAAGTTVAKVRVWWNYRRG